MWGWGLPKVYTSRFIQVLNGLFEFLERLGCVHIQSGVWHLFAYDSATDLRQHLLGPSRLDHMAPTLVSGYIDQCLC